MRNTDIKSGAVFILLLAIVFLAGCQATSPSIPASSSTPLPTASTQSPSQTEAVDWVLKVGGLTVTPSEYQAEYERVKEQLIRDSQIPDFDENQPGGEDVRSKIREQALYQLTSQLLVRWDATARDIQVSPQELAREMEILWLIYGSDALYEQELSRSYDGSEPRLEEDLRQRLLLEKVLAANYPSVFAATSAQLEADFLANEFRFSRPWRAHLEQMTLTPTQVGQAEMLLGEGKSADQVVAQFPAGQIKDHGYLTLETIEPEWLKVVQSAPDEAWVKTETPSGIVFLRVLEQVPARQFTFEEVLPLVWRQHFASQIEEYGPQLFAALRSKYPPQYAPVTP